MVEEYLKQSGMNERKPVIQHDNAEDYEYDIYYFDDRIEEDNLLHKYQLYDAQHPNTAMLTFE